MDLWSEGFQEPSVEFPDRIVDDYIQGFEKATAGLLALALRELEDIERIGKLRLMNFQYRVDLTSRVLRAYSFEVMSFGYDVTMYPVFVLPEEGIAREILPGRVVRSSGVKIEDEEGFREMVEAIFKSANFKNTVGGLLKVSRAKGEEA